MANKKIVLTVRLILEKENHILMLHQTINNGGGYTLIGGKIEHQEFAVNALIRESREEAGISLKEKKLKLIHVAQINKKEEMQIVLVFKAKKWKGIMETGEPEKFRDVLWVSLDHLPLEMPAIVRHLIKQYKKGRFYSEFLNEEA